MMVVEVDLEVPDDVDHLPGGVGVLDLAVVRHGAQLGEGLQGA